MNELSEVELAYEDMVEGLTKPGGEILESLTPGGVHLWHMATGVSGEAGELLDAVKKYVVYNKGLDRKNIIEELGDLEFYMAGVRDSIGVSREDVLKANMKKLAGKGGRYENGYSDKAAVERRDKND